VVEFFGNLKIILSLILALGFNVRRPKFTLFVRLKLRDQCHCQAMPLEAEAGLLKITVVTITK
jgi:hypothetical protein